eukprot:scaffold2971_cov274-Pinguiococcus_pyrenoidosus.AAC.4
MASKSAPVHSATGNSDTSLLARLCAVSIAPPLVKLLHHQDQYFLEDHASFQLSSMRSRSCIPACKQVEEQRISLIECFRVAFLPSRAS